MLKRKQGKEVVAVRVWIWLEWVVLVASLVRQIDEKKCPADGMGSCTEYNEFGARRQRNEQKGLPE
jgi:hypothetical protein